MKKFGTSVTDSSWIIEHTHTLSFIHIENLGAGDIDSSWILCTHLHTHVHIHTHTPAHTQIHTEDLGTGVVDSSTYSHTQNHIHTHTHLHTGNLSTGAIDGSWILRIRFARSDGMCSMAIFFLLFQTYHVLVCIHAHTTLFLFWCVHLQRFNLVWTCAYNVFFSIITFFIDRQPLSG